jgi:hypothetical protein
LACSFTSGSIVRLDDDPADDAQLPPTLADTGAFSDLANLTPNPGIITYQVNLPFWSDAGNKMRWFCVPSTNDFLKFRTQDTFGAPQGTVWIKHFSILMTNGVLASKRRLETRFLVRNQNGAYGITYRWDSAANATLVPEQGADELLVREMNGRPFNQVWRYPSRAECLSCHTKAAGYSLSFNAAQMHRTTDNSLQRVINAGYFTNAPSSLTAIKTIAHPTNESVSLEWRSRSWLAVNCSYCHRPNGGGGGLFDVRLSTPTASAGLINGPLNDNGGDSANRVIVPGDVVHSQLWQRLNTRGARQMPPIATVRVDSQGASVVRRWIESLAAPPAVAEARLAVTEMIDGFRLNVSQPANRGVWIETIDSLDHTNWEPLELPEIERLSFSKNPLEYQVELEPGESRFFRVQTEEP